MNYADFVKTNSATNDTTVSEKQFVMVDNYIYFHHLDEFIILPTYADGINDSQSASWVPTQIMGRSAPIYTYQYTGPRTVTFSFDLHRDMMNDINLNNGSIRLSRESEVFTSMVEDEDYVDRIIRYMQASCLPKYNISNKVIDPPVVSIRLGEDFFIKGVITSGVSVTWNYPIIKSKNGDTVGDRYARVKLGFTVAETDPFDAETIIKTPRGLRGISTTLEKKLGRV